MSDEDKSRGDIDARITDAIAFMRRVAENDSVNRERAIYWRKFRFGDQWPAEIISSRELEKRPCITVNKTDVYCLHVENQQRQQRPRIKVDPTNGEASKKNADIIKGMIRHIESTDGGADIAYDTGFSSAATEGVGYWRVLSRFTDDDSFEQELYLSAVEDPLTVYYDDHSVMPDGSDAEEVLVVTDMGKAAFKAAYPDANDGANWLPSADGVGADWITKDTVRVAEYFTIKRDRQMLYRFPGQQPQWGDLIDARAREMADQAIEMKVDGFDKRMSARRTVQWCKVTAIEVLDERDLPGKWIPVFPVYARKAIIDGKRRRFGLVKNAVGPQQMSNFWKTSMTESVALAPKAKWVMEEGQDEGHEDEWATANMSSRATLRFKRTNIDGQPGERPERVQPEPPPEGAMAMAQSVDNDLSAVLGIVEPAQRIKGNVSGKALNAERLSSDQNTFDLYDGLTRTIAFTGRYLLNVMKYYYPEPGRVVRIIGDDGKSKTQAINQPSEQDPAQVLNDITVGQYDVVMDTGPGYNTKRQEAVESMMPLFENNEELMKTAGDVMFRNMDFPGSDTIADRLAAANPLSQVDEESDVPPAAQTMIKGLQQQLKMAGEQIQHLDGLIKSRADVEGMRQAAESHRTVIKEAAATQRNREDNAAWTHEVATRTATQAHDTVIKTETQKTIQAMKDRIAVILAQMDAEAADQSSDETTERAI